MPSVYRKAEPIPHLGARTQRVFLVLERPVRRFLEQPGNEAIACFHKIFNAFAEFPLLGLSAIAGLVGLFAYVKALLELDRDQIYAGSLISAGDVTDFAVRLGVPFVLLVCALAALIACLIGILALNHRSQPTTYWLLTTFALIGFGVGLALYAFWVNVPWLESVLISMVFLIGVGAMGWLARRLYRMGMTGGIKNQDRLQRGMLGTLRFIAHPGGLLLLLGAVGLYLALSQNSVLFDRALRPFAHDTSATLCPNELSFLETKSLDRPLVTRKRMARLGSMWVLEQGKVGAQSESQQCGPDGKQPSVKINNLAWMFLRSEDLSCVRPFTIQEWASTDGPKRQCVSPTESVKPPATRPPATIAEYAETLLNCDPSAFGENAGDALVFNFNRGDPRNDLAIKNWKHSQPGPTFRTVRADALTRSYLEGVRGSAGGNTDLAEFRHNTQDPGQNLWVLGFASVAGHSTLNADLSENRARAVAEFIGPQAARIHSRGLGAALMSGAGWPEQDEREQIAVAFVCRVQAIRPPASETTNPSRRTLGSD